MNEPVPLKSVLADSIKSFSREDNLLIESGRGIYSWLEGLLNAEHEIVDPKTACALSHVQYASSYFALSAVIMGIISGEKKHFDTASRVFKKSVLKTGSRRTTADNVFAFAFAAFLLEACGTEPDLAAELKNIAQHLNHLSTKDSKEGNNNFLLRLLCDYMLHGGVYKSNELAEYLFHWQLKDGIYFDYPRNPLARSEIMVSLAYHSRTTFIALLAYFVTGNKYILESCLKALSALNETTARDGEAFYFGRSMNSLFACSNAVASLALASRLPVDCGIDKGQAALLKDRIFSFYAGYRHKDGSFALVPNERDKEFCGYEKYMYPSVYNSYACALFLFSGLLAGPAETEKPRETEKPAFNKLSDSGFILFQTAGFSTALNIKPPLFIDTENGVGSGPTFAGHSPLFLKYRGTDLLPSLPIRENEPGRGYYAKFDPTTAGFNPFIKTGRGVVTFSRASRVSLKYRTNTIFVYVSGPLLEIKLKRMNSILRKALKAVNLVFSLLGARLPKPLAYSDYQEVRFTEIPGSRYDRLIKLEDDSFLFLDLLPADKWQTSLRLCELSVAENEILDCSYPGLKLSAFVMNSRFENPAELPTSKGPAKLWTTTAPAVPINEIFSGLTLLYTNEKAERSLNEMRSLIKDFAKEQ
ncbi:MAG TPA: hypothetical protein DEE98_02120 [Elusimicrobia bacterium]|nr:MAG: hypothetical protein A2278_08240 [Elusimicrobia bacterium RIFOXYA12_FULL_49_49]OGS09831.1 MAG: hypothetical protein A2204_07230 [Elusimicrobia bacterium RIFOXYA1_FULL_47_7]OGS15946.1 MAG: hypothetical protein A2251_02025 [Elusimicrobia bacterium RIFOXYA2_FULL_47_53]OGS26372.1 MAG: hypothetical protein A2339_03245 [Elusimicrobia bacterium RIFOXYB12_FULL_50_12]OGS29114.1 MAG: hypothetical protein A2323_04565 [Elusimicrobia bacterium RIFOXYB2_FULL_46_23]HBU69158.1 hypothetical protein [El